LIKVEERREEEKGGNERKGMAHSIREKKHGITRTTEMISGVKRKVRRKATPTRARGMFGEPVKLAAPNPDSSFFFQQAAKLLTA
jgi:hypothetical protein